MSKRITRRTFSQATAGALAAAALFVPARAFGANDKIGMGLIGAGGMGRGNMGQFLRNDDVQFLAVCDVDQTHIDRAKEQVDKRYQSTDCKTFKDYRELIALDGIDAVCIATPDHWHGLCCLAAAKAKKDIYCQKPMTHTFEEGRLVADAVKANNLIFQVGSQQRSTFNFQWGVELVLNGHIGKVQHIEVGLPTGHKNPPGPVDEQPPAHLDYDLWCGPSKVLPYHPKRVHYQWRWNLNYGGGQLMDWIGHHNDIAHWGMGWDNTGPVEVQAVGFVYPDRLDVWNAAYAYEVQCKYANGTTTSISSKNRMGTKWIGESGEWVFVDRGKFETSKPEWKAKDFDRGAIKAYESRSHEGNFIDCVKSRKPTICTAETGHRSITPGHLGLVSQARGGKLLKWDPEKEIVTNDQEANALLKFTPRKPHVA